MENSNRITIFASLFGPEIRKDILTEKNIDYGNDYNPGKIPR